MELIDQAKLYLSYNSFCINIIYHDIFSADDPVPPMQLAMAKFHSIDDASFRKKGHAD